MTNKIHALIVDDQLGVRMLLSEAFKLEGVEVATAASGEEAIEFFKECCPEVIFLDLKMPKKDGLCVFSDLQRMGYKGRIVIMTGMEASDIDMDVDYILSKPFDIEEAVNVLHELLNQRGHTCYTRNRIKEA